MGEKALKAINIDLPAWMVRQLDAEAEKLGITRKALINVLLATILEGRRAGRAADSTLLNDFGYVRAVERSFTEEWGSDEDEEAFRDI